MAVFSRFVRWTAGIAGILLLLFICYASWLLFAVQLPPDFTARKGQLHSATETSTWQVAGGSVAEISLKSTSGLQVRVALRRPQTPLPGSPLLLMLGGQETGRAAVELLPDTRGVTVAALSYPFGVIPHRSAAAMIGALPRIQQGIFDTPAATMLAIDYLLQRQDLEFQGLELAGISFGAFIAAVPAVLDDRVDRLWLIHGAGDVDGVIEASLEGRVESAWLRSAIARFLASVAGSGQLDAERWVGQFSPRPIIVVNATQDSTLTREAIAVLHAALEPPFEVIWSPGDHVHPKRPETIRYITDLLFERIKPPGV